MSRILTVIATVTVCAGSPARLAAEPIRVDQVSPFAGTGPHGSIRGDISQAQTFTVGLSGQLISIEVLLGRTPHAGDLIVDVRPTIGGVPIEDDARALATLTIPAAQIPETTLTPVQLNFSAARLHFEAGERLAFVLRSPTTLPTSPFILHEYTLHAVEAQYPGGDAYSRSPSIGRETFVQTTVFPDFAFATFVQPDPVPEPTTVALVGSGLLLGALGRRRRRRRAHDE